MTRITCPHCHETFTLQTRRVPRRFAAQTTRSEADDALRRGVGPVDNLLTRSDTAEAADSSPLPPPVPTDELARRVGFLRGLLSEPRTSVP
jgi:hypothetical protein